MQPRCAVCDGDNDIQTLCDLHHWLCVIRHNVDVGLISDWPPLATSKYPVVVFHREQMMRPACAPIYWQVILSVTLTGKRVLLAQTPVESAGDWMAVNHLLDWGASGNGGTDGNGRAA